MKKKILAVLLAVVLAVSLLPGTVFAADQSLPDWNFLFAIFKNVDANVDDGNGVITHTTYSMTQDEIDLFTNHAAWFMAYMNQVGVMNAHVHYVVIDTPITELELAAPNLGSYLSSVLAAPILAANGIDLDQFDHVTCVANLRVLTVGYFGVTGAPFENGSGHSFINSVYMQPPYAVPTEDTVFPQAVYVHEFLHFMEQWNKKWGPDFDIHSIRLDYYMPDGDEGKACYTDIIHNRARGNAGTGVVPAAWQYSPRKLRTTRELIIPDDVTTIGAYAFRYMTNLEKVIIPSGVTSIGERAFDGCSSLKSVTIPNSVTSIGYAAFYGCERLESVTLPGGMAGLDDWAFGYCSSLKSVTIPSSLTGVGYAAFYGAGLKDVCYEGTQAQWNRISFGEYNGALTNADIHYNTIAFFDVAAGKYYAKAVAWAAEKGYVAGNGDGTFRPDVTCTEVQILTFLWHAEGSPASDVSAPFAASLPNYYRGAVNWAYGKGMIDALFEPNTSCTRGSTVNYLWQVFGSQRGAPAGGFADVSADNAAVNWAVKEGVIGGYGDSTFRPDVICSRGMIATLLYQAYAPAARE